MTSKDATARKPATKFAHLREEDGEEPDRGEDWEEEQVSCYPCYGGDLYPQYDRPREYTQAKHNARDKKLGLWADSRPMPHWEWPNVKKRNSPGESALCYQ